MAKFGKKSKTSQDIPTAALPDIIFMLLFFFMVTTVMRETDILVNQKLPKAVQLSKLEFFKEFHLKMLKNEIYLPPSPFESYFISTSHTIEDIVKFSSAIKKSN